MSLKQVIESTDTRGGRLFDLSVQLLVVFSLVEFSVETLPGLSPAWLRFLSISEIVIVALFTVEYALRVLVADRERSFVFSFFGVIDLLAILPFYLALGVDLRSVRAFRLLRLFRILKLARYSAAVRRFRTAPSLGAGGSSRSSC